MTSFYKCSCGYTTKNKDYAMFHTNHEKDCEAREFQSAFPGRGGIIAMVKHAKTTDFVKWYDSEESLLALHGSVNHKYSGDCDREFIKLQTKALHEGVIMSYDGGSVPIIRNDSAVRLFEDVM
jgi:hypothetical protein